MSVDYDIVVIGAGFSGLAAALRSSLSGKKVLLLERHIIPGGLNSYYTRQGHCLDVGLHALSNFAPASARHKILNKILRQLRLSYDFLQVRQQNFSQILFPESTLRFSNDRELLISEVERLFPQEKENFLRLIHWVEQFDNKILEEAPYQSAKKEIIQFIDDPLLVEMLLLPLMMYGSSWANDIDLSLFIILFRSIYLEGLFRPAEGIRPLLTTMLEQFKNEGGEVRFQFDVSRIEKRETGGLFVWKKNNKESVFCSKVVSSIGYRATCALIGMVPEESATQQEPFSFVETQFLFPSLESKEKNSVVFYSQKNRFDYSCPKELWSEGNGLFCFSPYFEAGEQGPNWVRITLMANPVLWKQLSTQEYRKQKESVANRSLALLQQFYANPIGDPLFVDTFTSKTIERYTGHANGAVYGGTYKLKSGQLQDNCYLCGTDQGLLGVVGSMMSGILVANRFLI